VFLCFLLGLLHGCCIRAALVTLSSYGSDKEQARQCRFPRWGGLPLFTELPRRGFLGNRASDVNGVLGNSKSCLVLLFAYYQNRAVSVPHDAV
jgi:hypothetical protein